MKRSNYLIFAILTLSCAKHSLIRDVREISAKELYKLLSHNKMEITVVDVRTPEEFLQGHIPSAINIDYFSPKLDSLLMTLPKNNTIILYCSHGMRSKNVAIRLINMGYRNVFSLKGGLKDWINRGLPIEKGQN
ncbi:MAG: rhodanese-like domain-containing protein [candidate division WOR-3 bacterium]